LDLESVIEHAHRVTGRSFASRDVKVGDRYGFHIVRLAGDLMAYVAKDDASWEKLALQRRMLARVAQRVSFRVPRPVGDVDTRGPIDLRERVPGATGPRFHDRIMNDAALRARVAAWIGETLAELHDAIANAELAPGLRVRDRDNPQYRPERLHAGIDAHLEGDLRHRAYAVVRAWHAQNTNTRADVYLHADFGSHNFAFDETTGMPVGVFDFHDGGRGPRFVDLKLVPSYGEDALAMALERYGGRASLADVRLAHAVTSLAYLAWRGEDPEAHDRGCGRDRAGAIAWVTTAIDQFTGI
jgi:hypothetical protein